MSDKIKPSEVSQVLLEQLNGISGNAQFDEVGTVLQVSDGVARRDEPRGRQRGLCAAGHDVGHQGGYGGKAHQAYCLNPRERQHAGPCDQSAGSGHRR